MKILKANPVVRKSLDDLKVRCNELKSKNIIPTLKVILVGDNPASLLYTKNKKKFCESFGANCEIINLDVKLTEVEFTDKVKEIAADKNVHGCFVQLPLPKHLSNISVGELIPASKDVDGFNSKNIAELFRGNISDLLLPCTPKGIIALLGHYKISIEGKHIVVIGRSQIVGRPLSLLLNAYNATVTNCHSKTQNIKKIIKNADIIVSAIGSPRFFTEDYFNENHIIIDVGINHDENGNLCGDIDFENVSTKVKAITPVPKGVGPMTILGLAQNLLQAAEFRTNK